MRVRQDYHWAVRFRFVNSVLRIPPDAFPVGLLAQMACSQELIWQPGTLDLLGDYAESCVQENHR